MKVCRLCLGKGTVDDSRIEDGSHQVARGERADPFMITTAEWARGITNARVYVCDTKPCPKCIPKEPHP